MYSPDYTRNVQGAVPKLAKTCLDCGLFDVAKLVQTFFRCRPWAIFVLLVAVGHSANLEEHLYPLQNGCAT